MALGAQEMKITVIVDNETAVGLASVSRSVQGVIQGINRQLASVVGRFEETNSRIVGLAAPIAASFGQLRGHLRALSEETGVSRLAEGFAGVTEHVRRAHEAVSEFLRPVAALTAMAGVGGVLESVKSTAERGERLHLESMATGLSVPQLAGLEYAGKLAGVENERTVRFVELLNRNLGNLAAGRAGKDLTQIFSDLGIKAGTAPGAALGIIEDRLRNLLAAGNVAEASRIAGAVGGQRSGVAMLPVLGQGSEHLGELAAESARHGQAMTEAQAEAAAKFMESYKQFDSSVIGLGQSISEALFPTLTPIIEQMTTWTDANREWISTHIGDAVKGVSATLKSIDWSGIGAAIAEVWRIIAGGAAWLGPAGTLGLLAGIKFGGAIMEFGRLGYAVGVASARMIAFPVAEFIASAAMLVPSITGVRDAWIALDLAADANPLGAAILAAGLLAGAAYEVWQHWDPIRDFFKRLWDDIVGYFRTAWGYIEPIVDSIDAAGGKIVGWLGGGQAGGRQVHRGAPASSPLSAAQADLAQRLVDEAASHGVDRAHALAMLGNANVESGLSAAPGGGMFQWSDPGRQAAMHAALGRRAGDAIAQFDYAIAEMKKIDPSWFDRSGDLTNSFRDEFEKPAEPFDRDAFTAAIASALNARSSGTASSAQQSSAHIRLDFKNLPSGVKPDISTSGNPNLDIGYAWEP